MAIGSGDKIEKIRALKDGGGTPGERSAAAAALDRIHSNRLVRITATVLNIDFNESYYEVDYRDLDGQRRQKRIRREYFQDPKKVVDILVREHASLPDDRVAAIAVVKDALKHKADASYQVTARTGRHGDSFVHPNTTFGTLAGNLRHEDSTGIDPALGLREGSLDEYCCGLRRAFKYSDYLLFTASVPAASVLLSIVDGVEPAMFHLQGTERKRANSIEKTKSSSGKTLATRVATSTVGRCRKNDLLTFDITKRAAEEFGFAHNHLYAGLDEEGRAIAGGSTSRIRTAELAYMLPSGRGAVRSKKATGDRNLRNLTWEFFVISSGEGSLDDPQQARRSEGTQVRMISIPVPPGGKGGIFNRVDQSRNDFAEECARLAKGAESTIAKNHGVVMPAYLSRLFPPNAVFDAIPRRVALLVDDFVRSVGAEANPWERRFAEKFGLVFAAAVVMSEFDIMPWTTKRARKAIRTMYRKARAAVSSVPEAANELIRQIRNAVKDGRRLPMLRKGQSMPEAQTARPLGCITNLPKVGRVVLVRHGRVKRLIAPRAIAPQVLRSLVTRKVIIKGNDDKLTIQKMIKGLSSKRRRYVCFVYHKLFRRA